MKRSASEILRNLESRIARLEGKTASGKFKVSVHCEHTGESKSYNMDLDTLQKTMKDLEKQTKTDALNHKKVFGVAGPKLNLEGAKFFMASENNGKIFIVNNLEHKDGTLFSYVIEILEPAKFGMALMSLSPIFRHLDF